MTSKKKRRNNKNKGSRRAATVNHDNAKSFENGGVNASKKEPIACQNLTLEKLTLIIKELPGSSEIRQIYDDGREEAASILNPKDCKEVVLDYVERGKGIDSKRLARKMPHTAQDLKEGIIECEGFLAQMEKLYDLKVAISGIDRPVQDVVTKIIPRNLPGAVDLALAFYSNLFDKTIDMMQVSSKQSLAECLKFATDATCEAQAKNLDQALFRSKKGSFLKSCLMYKCPVRCFETLLSDQKAESGFQFATMTELESMKQEASYLKMQLCRAVCGIGLRKLQDMKNSCWECGRTSTTLLTCSSCGVASYCGEDCHRQSWRSGHKLKCSALSYRFSLQQISWKALQDAHKIASHDGLQLNKNKDYEVYFISFRYQPLTICEGSPWLPYGPSMKTYYENLHRIQSGEFWIWKNPDTMDEHNQKLNTLSQNDQKEQERLMMSYILYYLCYSFEHSETGQIAASSEDAPHFSFAKQLSETTSTRLTMPLDRFPELYCSDSFSLCPSSDNTTPWQRKKEAEYIFRTWAHK